MVIQIYSKPDCSLCDDAKRVLAQVCADLKLPWSEVDITLDPTLWERHRYDLPVIAIDGRPAFKLRVDARTLARRLRR